MRLQSMTDKFNCAWKVHLSMTMQIWNFVAARTIRRMDNITLVREKLTEQIYER
jgi:hypothetical protein